MAYRGGTDNDGDSSPDEMQMYLDMMSGATPRTRERTSTYANAVRTPPTARHRHEPSPAQPSPSGQSSRSRQSRDSPQQGTDLDFRWDHFALEVEPESRDMSGFEEMFGEQFDSSSYESDGDPLDDDIKQLSSIGFIIDYPQGLLGKGFNGFVYKGYYGPNAAHLNNPVVQQSKPFAVKIIEFGKGMDSATLESRESFETEKYILTNVYHKNLVVIRMIINMGEQLTCHFTDDPEHSYPSSERVFLIMDFADQGDLNKYLEKNEVSTQTQIDWIKGLFLGMLYLHRNDIVHGDVHAGNVLLYTEGKTIVAKWGDFGLGYVATDKQYRFKTPVPQDMERLFKTDIRRMEQMLHGFVTICRDQSRESRSESTAMNELVNMIRVLKTAQSLEQVFNQFQHILK